jgi:branched-chain amino acid transport system permease protein
MMGAVELIRRHRVAAVMAFLLVFPLLMPYQALAINILIFGLFAVGFNLLFGYTGLLSFGHAAFLGVGSYLTGIGMVHMGLPWGVAVLLGVVSAALAGVLIGYLAIRTRGIYFSMVTLALAQIVYYAFYKAEKWTAKTACAASRCRRWRLAASGSTSSTPPPSTTSSWSSWRRRCGSCRACWLRLSAR